MAAVLSGSQLHWVGAALCAANVCWLFPISKQFLRFGSDGKFKIIGQVGLGLIVGLALYLSPYEETAWATFYRDITAAPTEPDEAY